MMPASFLACMAVVSAFYRLPPQALPAIQRIEGGHSSSIGHNHNGTDDLGVMQVNSAWLPELARRTGVPQSRLRIALIRQNCFNIAVAGAILRIYLNEAHGDVVTAIGYYHSHTSGRREAYAMRVLALPLGTAAASPTTPHRFRRRSRHIAIPGVPRRSGR
jgi:soluble lytic murein transglycosylase-like protein